MAKNTSKKLRTKTIYEVYVRNHSSGGKFEDVINDLTRIKMLGADIVWLMPIHPIGEMNKKGELGCPYSILDYSKVNPEYGTLEDFKNLVDTVHAHGMTIMIDVVYNHTSHDAEYLKLHPEYYYRKANGELGNKVSDWSDVIDLDYTNHALWEAQINALEYWVGLGVDGFRCDVASMVPVEFWMAARERLLKINPDCVLLAETIHGHFLESVRNEGIYAASDCEVYSAFDICYDYDTHGEFLKYLSGEITLDSFIEKKRIQEYIYPENYVKLRFLENHDQPRIAGLLSKDALIQWTAFMFFEKGATLVYSGQEALDSHLPSLFDKDLINWEGLATDFPIYVSRLANLKKNLLYTNGRYKLHTVNKLGVILGSYVDEGLWHIGIFNVEVKSGKLKLSSSAKGYPSFPELSDGFYLNLYDNKLIQIVDQEVDLSHAPILIEYLKLV